MASRIRALLPLLIPAAAGLLMAAYAATPTRLQRIVDEGHLVVVTRDSPSTYYTGAEGPSGFEYDLARLFTDHLGVELQIMAPASLSAILPMVADGRADLAAAGLAVTQERSKRVRFGPAYDQISQQLVYRKGTPTPASLSDLDGEVIDVVSGSSHAERLKWLASGHPDINWYENEDADSKQLLHRVWKREISYTVVNSNDISLNQRVYPELRVAFDVTEPQPLAWAFAKGEDDSLVAAAEDFFELIRDNGQLRQLHERYYGHVQDFDYVETRRFISHIYGRLPEYKPYFVEAARRNDLDWRLLAAMGYQESHWNPAAVSPTGVRGIMMLTNTTASELGIEDRIDPNNSIDGGARYFSLIKRRIAQDIAEPDRSWFALAAYNMGLGHLEDARALTAQRGGDPLKWVDVKESLPLLTRKEWFEQTRHGHARGNEALQYVENIRSYYDTLVWRTDPARAAPQLTAITSSPLTGTATAAPVL
ncbi:MAG: membrane-bound lytic murein transglycosylase MltF [Gammaproteobacteria bacterium]|nr:membrane-bound lytic murein transglycosylase MltF [Gammaproteobacteria bacterium]